MIRATLGLAALLISSPSLAAPAGVVKITPAEAAGPVLERPETTKGDNNGVPFKWFEMLKSADKTVSAGFYEEGPSDISYDAYEVDEFMYFVTGGVTLTAADGSVTEVGPGDGVTIPKGWKGRWKSSGYTKYYVTYESGR